MAIAATKIASGFSNSATTACSFTAQAAGTWLVLHVSCDDYRTTSGSNRPESTGWTLQTSGQDEIGFYVWTLVAAGSETSVSYTIGSASPSAWEVIAVTGAAGTLSNTPTATHTHGGSTSASGSVTPPAANAYNLACISGYHSTTQLTVGSWSNSWTQVGYQGGITTGNKETVASAGLATSSATAVSTTLTWASTTQFCSYGAALVFTEASGGGSPLPPSLIMPTRRAF